MVVTGLSYSGTGNSLANDGTSSYARSPGDDLLGVKSGSTSVYAWTDTHTDVVGQFTATGTVLSGSTTYSPLGKVQATASMLGTLGYQSSWTEPATGKVNMAARWYNTDTGQFDSHDTVALDPVSAGSASANPFAYVGDNPLTNTDTSGHWTDMHSSYTPRRIAVVILINTSRSPPSRCGRASPAVLSTPAHQPK